MLRLELTGFKVPLIVTLACSPAACSGGSIGTGGPASGGPAGTVGTTTGGSGATNTTGDPIDVGGLAANNAAANNNATANNTAASTPVTGSASVASSTSTAGEAATSTTASPFTAANNANSSNTNTTSGAGGGMNAADVTVSSTTDSTNGTTGGVTASDVFGSCRFHFGAIDQFARNNPAIAAELDFFTPGWMGVRDTFDQGYVCDDTDPGGPLEGLVPVVVAYVAAFYAKRHNGLNDCNVGSPDLCTHGALFIKQNLASILDVYRSYAQGYADCYGTERRIVFEMEPDYYQYTYDSQTDPMTPQEAGSIMSDFVNAIKQYLPNAVFSMDISPWVAPNNGEDGGANWYANFDMSLFTFVHTSGGSTDASDERIRGSNNMTWAGVSSASGKFVLADTGYGVNGSSEGHDSNWDNPDYINQRIADGVVSISQYNPNSNWGNTIAQIRGQLDTPPGCQ